MTNGLARENKWHLTEELKCPFSRENKAV